MSLTFSLKHPPTVNQCKVFHVDRAFYNGLSFTMVHNDSLHFFDYSAHLEHGLVQRQIRPGDWLFTPAGTALKYLDLGSGIHHFYHFRRHIPKLKSGQFTLPDTGNCGNLFPEYWTSSSRIIRDFSRRDLVHRWKIADHGLFVLLQRMKLDFSVENIDRERHRFRRSDLVVDQVAEWIQSNLRQSLRIPELCERFGISPNYLNLCFRKKYGMSVSRYQMNHRLDFARQLIEETTLPFKSIGVETGFADSHHFNKKIRKRFGIPPSNIRQQFRKTP